MLEKIDAISDKDKTRTNVIKVLAEELPKYKPQFEKPTDLLNRKRAIDDFLKRQVEQKPLEGKKNAIISHSMLIGALTSDGVDPSDKHGLQNYAWI